MREKIRSLVESSLFERFILIVILLNTIDLGLETSPYLIEHYGLALEVANIVFIAIYLVEMLLKLYAWRGAYFKNGWNIFDFCIVLVSLMPTAGVFSGVRIVRILRVLRTLRALRLVSGIKQLRKIVQAVISSLPGIGWTGVLMLLVYYVYAIIGIHLFREAAPELFGGFPESFVTLFSLTTMEGWQDTVFPFTEANPWNWLYFLTFLVISSFILLNLVVGIVVDNIDEMSRIDAAEAQKQSPHSELLSEMQSLREQMDKVQGLLEKVKDSES